MSLKAVQLNHPGAQKPFPSNGYRILADGKILRDWNNDNSHYRKFILNKGKYIKDREDFSPKKDTLLVWGEWEGNSFFEPFCDAPPLPNGMHKPIHSTQIFGSQNTDPYIFGRQFYYATCRQRGQMCQLDQNSLIIFGVPDESGFFLLDTVFVVDDYNDSLKVKENEANNYSSIYKEETLGQLPEYLGIGENLHPEKRLYKSLTWRKNTNYFSYVPCKVKDREIVHGFERVKIPIDGLPIDINLCEEPRTPVMFMVENDLEHIKEVWNAITNYTEDQEFFLGIEFKEPSQRIINIKKIYNTN